MKSNLPQWYSFFQRYSRTIEWYTTNYTTSKFIWKTSKNNRPLIDTLVNLVCRVNLALAREDCFRLLEEKIRQLEP
jgi:hypothetical protein